ncbi:MAG: hypothetical protein WCK90_03000 [archaeon]
MKGVFVIMDGVADEACSQLGGKTPLEYAKTPNLDKIAGKSEFKHCFSVAEGVSPESSSAVVSLLGYDYAYAPRGPLEAVGAGIKIKKGDLVLRCNFATVDSLKDGNILDSRAGRTLTTYEANVLAKAINKNVKLPFKFEFIPTRGHRAVLVFRGGFSDNISNADPFYGTGYAKSGNRKMVYANPLDDEDDSKLSADLVNQFIRASHEVLEKHPINVSRARKGQYPGNLIICRDAGNEPVKFNKLKGKWMALGYNPLEIGIAKAVGMDCYTFRYPRLWGTDVYGNFHKGLKKAVKYAKKMMKKYENRYDYFYVHFKETDLPGHDGKPLEKVKMIEFIDERFFSFLSTFIGDRKLVITADHTTSCKMKGHTADAVPVLIYPGNGGGRFTEDNGKKGKKIVSKKLLESTLL